MKIATKLRLKATAWLIRGILEAARDRRMNLRTRIAIREVDKMLKGSWKTSANGIAGILAGIGGLCAMGSIVAKQGFGVIDEKFIAGALASWASIQTGIGLVFARDNDKTSEDVKARDTEVKG